jgi:outer membrane protein OmpA-like peptidoglycan-associated protein
MRLRSTLWGVLVVGLCGPAQSQNSLASDVVTFLLRQVDPGSEADICLAAEADCVARAQAEAFDLSVTFGFDTAVLTASARENLAQVSAALNTEDLVEADIIIEGHTDAQGPEGYNQLLSEQRAQAVADFLHEAGVAADRMTVFGIGEAAPRVFDPFDPDNRRVELRLALE